MDNLSQKFSRNSSRSVIHPQTDQRHSRLSALLTAKRKPGQPKGCAGQGSDFDQGYDPGNTVIDGAPVPSCSLGQALPVGWSQLDELATQRLELNSLVVVIDVLRVVRDGVDQPVP